MVILKKGNKIRILTQNNKFTQYDHCNIRPKYMELRETLPTFFSSGTKRLLIFFFTFSFSTWGERHTLFTMLTVPTSLFSQYPAELSAQSQILNSLTQQTRGASRRPQLDWPHPGPSLN